MFVVTGESELNWWLRRFAPRITWRLSPDFVEIASARGVAQSATVLSVLRRGDRTVVTGIGNEPITDAAADRIPVFRPLDSVLPPDDAAARFLAVLLKRLPPSGGFIRPTVLVEGLWSLEGVSRSHRQFQHPTKPGTVTIAGNPGVDVPAGTLNSVLKQAGLKK